MAYAGFLRTLPAPASTLSGFVCLLDTTWFTQADSNALDGTTFINGGGSLRLYTDATKTTQLPVDVVSFVTGGTPEVKVFTRLPSYASGETIWVESDASATTQPVSTSTYGSEAVWQDMHVAVHGGNLSDITGNGNNLSVIGGASVLLDHFDFDGTGDGIGVVLASGLTPPLSLFVVTTPNEVSSSENRRIISLGDTAVAGRRVVVGKQSGKTSRENNNDGSTNTLCNIANLFVNTTAKNYITATEGSGSTRANYSNSSVATNATSLSYPSGSLDSFRLGQRPNGASNEQYDGKIYEAWVYNSEVSQDTHDSVYANQNSPSTFGSSSGWVTGGGGVSGVSAFDIANPIFSATGSATLPNPIGLIGFDIDKPLFSSSGSATLPNPIGSVSFDIDKPLFSSSGSATLPQPIGSVSFDVDKPIFSGAGSATLPNPIGSVSFDINNPTFSVSGAATLPNPTGSVSFTINAPTFAATGSATQVGNVGDVAFTVDSPTFSASGTATLPQPIGAASFAIDSPVFSATGTVSGLVQNYADDAIVTIRYGQNTEVISYGKNIVIVTSGNNIVKL